MNPLITIVIVNWKNWRDTADCLDSVIESEYREYDLIILDNGSGNESVEMLLETLERISSPCPTSSVPHHLSDRDAEGIVEVYSGKLHNSPSGAKYGNVTLLQSSSNLGFSKPNNIGIRMAMDRGSDLVWLLNSDTIIERGSLRKLVSAIQKERGRIVAIAPLVLDFPVRKEDNIVQSAGGFIDWKFYPCYYPTGRGVPSEEIGAEMDKCDWVTGAALMLDVQNSPIKFLDESYFFGCEDVELCVRLGKLGYGSVVVKDALIWHKGGAARKLIRDGWTKTWFKNNSVNLKFNLRNNPHIVRKLPTFLMTILYFWIAEMYPNLRLSPDKKGNVLSKFSKTGLR